MELRNLSQNPWKIAVLAAIALFLSLAVFLAAGSKLNKTNSFYVVFSPDRESVKVGQAFTLKLLVGGKDSDKIVAEDVNLEFAKDRFSLISAKPGNIFKNPIIIKWDLQEGKFALAENPQNPVLGVDTESKPTLLELEFMPLSSGNGAKISLGEESLVYLYKVGPVYLRGAAGYYQIKD